MHGNQEDVVMRTARSYSGRQAGIARNINPRVRAAARRVRAADNPYHGIQASRGSWRAFLDAYRPFIRRVLQAA